MFRDKGTGIVLFLCDFRIARLVRWLVKLCFNCDWLKYITWYVSPNSSCCWKRINIDLHLESVYNSRRIPQFVGRYREINGNLFLLEFNEIWLYIQFLDWFLAKNHAVWFQIDRKIVNTVKLCLIQEKEQIITYSLSQPAISFLIIDRFELSSHYTVYHRKIWSKRNDYISKDIRRNTFI